MFPGVFRVKPSLQQSIVNFVTQIVNYCLLEERTPNLAWICKGYHGYSACTTDNAASAQANTKFYKYSNHFFKSEIARKVI